MALYPPSLTNSHDALSQQSLRDVLLPLLASAYNRVFTSASLAITEAGSTTVTAGAGAKGVVNGVPVTALAGVMPALSGTVLQNNFQVYCFYMSIVGAYSIKAGVQASSLLNVTWPSTDANTAMIGFVVVNPTGGNFVGGTTALDAAGVNTTYYNCVGGFEPGTIIL